MCVMQPFLPPRCIALQRGVDDMRDENTESLFTKAVEEYSDMVTGLCLLRLGNRQDAEDCYQNVFLKLLKNKEMLQAESVHLKAWLIRVAINECKNHYRFRCRHKTESLESVTLFYEDEHDRRLMAEVMELPKLYREAIYLHYYIGYSVAEIAALLKVPQNTIKSRLKRGRDMLGKIIAEEEAI
ncbi:MAG: sigma-70 family RNA polymerase sigma factor [Ruminococcaceae bacterium]|nr:sigma-70 family RNA polymerase sigma factor [Oscillospiraceae bacterium]